MLGLPPGPAPGMFPDTVTVELHQTDLLTDPDVEALTTGFEVIVFAAGADDRVTPKAPAARFYYEANIRSAVHFTAAALRASVKRFVLMDPYFTHFDRQWPYLKLAEHHPYIESRKQQQDLCKSIAGSKMVLVSLELPCIFGSMPGVVPLWMLIVSYVRSGVTLYHTNGGSNIMPVRAVAEAIAGACERIDDSVIYQVGDRNVKWTEFLQALCAIVDRADNSVHIFPDGSLGKLSWLLDALHSMQVMDSGLHAAHFTRVQTFYAFFRYQRVSVCTELSGRRP